MAKSRVGALAAALLFSVGSAACGGSKSSNGKPTCESICASAMTCPNFDVNNTFGVPSGASSCGGACANAHAIINAAHCQAEYDAVAKCASMHDQCTEDLEVVCAGEGGTFLGCLQSGLGQDGGTNPDGAQACNAIDLLPVTVSKTATATPFPDTSSFTGGVIADGTYVLTEMLYYGTSTAPGGTRKETLIFSGLTFEAAYSVDGGAEERYTAMFTTPLGSFGEIDIHLSCFASAPSAALNTTTAYTATATELRVVAETNEVSTYTKQ